MCLSTAAGVRQRNSRLCAKARGAGVPDEPLLLHRHHLAPCLVPRRHRGADCTQGGGGEGELLGKPNSAAARPNRWMPLTCCLSPLPLRCLSPASPLPLHCLSAASPPNLGRLSAGSRLALARVEHVEVEVAHAEQPQRLAHRLQTRHGRVADASWASLASSRSGSAATLRAPPAEYECGKESLSAMKSSPASTSRL